ncbi:MAG TPA: hypothetical protein DD435_13350 [Cyanobacteria bacterium UBA8530]|nr:hypothetical protein [Cyanobacteria bacterium UBA8530]
MNRTHRILAGVLGFAVALTAPQAYAAVKKAPARAQSIPVIEKMTLSNGIPVLFIERHDLPIVSAELIVKAGQALEPSTKAGIAGLTAYLLTKGSQKHKAEDFSELSEFVGGSIHAAAGRDRATIAFSFLKKDLPLALELFREAVMFPTFPEGEFKKAKELTLAEIESSLDDPNDISRLLASKVLYGDHPYGRPICGTLGSVKGIQRKDALDFHRSFFRPETSTLVVVGDITSAELMEKFNLSIGDWKNESPAGTLFEPAPAPRFSGKKVVLVDADVNQAYISLGNTALRRNDPDYHRSELMSFLFGGGYLSHLYREIRTNLGLAYSVHSQISPGAYAGSASVKIQTKSSSSSKALESILFEMKKMNKKPVGRNELDSGKIAMKGEFARGLESNDELLDQLVDIASNHLGSDTLLRYSEIIDGLNAEDLLKASKKYFDPDNYVISVVGKASELEADLDRFGVVEKWSKRSLIE